MASKNLLHCAGQRALRFVIYGQRTLIYKPHMARVCGRGRPKLCGLEIRASQAISINFVSGEPRRGAAVRATAGTASPISFIIAIAQ